MGELSAEKFRTLLLQRQQALSAVSGSGDQAAGVVELDQARVGRLSRMDAMQMQAMSQNAVQRREAELARISAALARLDSGDFGYCLRCDEPIAEKRLEVDPSATLCISCAERRD